ncbi:MAG: ABC transporter ATP-binding protein/permease [Defluviitaleaceae bacterium]|nr:ABC transporter ATP-binding protein/permease [Defluviitaleaceae bacterium]MCL2274943.1 ABC transporter ATP-binding protein/permease [Defluviitaleaceae bacterium]
MMKVLRVTLPMVWKTMPFTCLAYLLLALAHGASWGIVAPVNQILYDALADLAFAGAGATLRYVYLGAAGVALVMVIQQVLNGVHNYIGSNLYNRKADGAVFKPALHKKFGRLPAQAFEDKEVLDNIEKAGEGCWQTPYLLMTFNDFIFFYGTYYVVMGIYLWSMRPLLLVALALIFVPVALSQIVEAKLWDKLEKESAPIRRRFEHYEGALISREKSKETRLFGVFHFFRRLYMDTLALLQQKEWSVQRKIAAITLGLNIVKAAGWVGIMALLFTSLTGGYITVGAFAAVYASIGMLFGALEEAFTRIKRDVSGILGKARNVIYVLEMDENLPMSTHAPDFAKGIIAENLTFSYPKADKVAVDGVSLHIKQGETIALVGENGSGKTTLVKLLMGLYKPETGSVSIGGCDTADTQESALFSQTSAIFQGYIQYVFTLAENVYISDYAAGGEMTHGTKFTRSEKGMALQLSDTRYANEDAVNRTVIEKLTAAGVDVTDTATFPQGLETVLSRDFGGVELSGGQWQRIAMARGMYRKHNFVVLDEPTAAIDPLEETRIYKQFSEYSHDKTAILVTHRLGSARIADRILVMENGKIIESGTHDALYAAKGKYTEMWDTQAERY